MPAKQASENVNRTLVWGLYFIISTGSFVANHIGTYMASQLSFVVLHQLFYIPALARRSSNLSSSVIDLLRQSLDALEWAQDINSCILLSILHEGILGSSHPCRYPSLPRWGLWDSLPKWSRVLVRNSLVTIIVRPMRSSVCWRVE